MGTRGDVWAFGCVLFEMLSGRRPYDGETLTDTLAAIVKNEPDWRLLPPGTPPAVKSVIARCLKKDPAQRLHDIADGRFQIEEALSDPAGSAAAVKPGRNRREWAGWIAAGLALGAVVFLAIRPPASATLPDRISFPIFPPVGTVFSGSLNTTVNVPTFALAPDGRALVFGAQAPGAKPMLWLRSLENVAAHQLAGTEGAQDPMWSPDSQRTGT